MFVVYCCCCVKPSENLLSMKTKSSHEDGKTLLDYLNSMFGVFLKECEAPDLICARCSKALQVAYHFINMVNKSKESARIGQIHNKEESLGSLSPPEMQHNILDKQNSPFNECHVGNELEFENNSKMSPPLNLTDVLKTFATGFNKDAGSSLVAKKYRLDFRCNICKISFDDKTSFVEHNRQEHKEITPYKCQLCNFYTCYGESLSKHCEKNHGLSNVSPDFYQRKEVPKMVDESPEFEISYSCISCNFEDPNQAVVDEHLFNEHSIEDDKESFVKYLFSCPACCRSFSSLRSAKIHYSMYHICSFKRNSVCKKRRFRCEKCGNSNKESVCEKRNIVNCNFCNLEFTSVLKYERHLQDAHFVAVKHECETCGKTFKCSEYLAVHRKRHNERNFQCDLCSKNYISNAELKVHKQRIHEIKHAAIACGVCGNKFANSTLLKYHENRAHKARLLRCDFCDFVSNSSSAWRTHQFSHTGKPYKCHFCKKEFAVRVLLREHLKKHHSTSLTNEDMAEMFKQAYGYISRFDAFSEQNNSLEISEINEIKLENEIEEFGLTLEDLMDDLLHQD